MSITYAITGAENVKKCWRFFIEFFLVKCIGKKQRKFITSQELDQRELEIFTVVWNKQIASVPDS